MEESAILKCKKCGKFKNHCICYIKDKLNNLEHLKNLLFEDDNWSKTKEGFPCLLVTKEILDFYQEKIQEHNNNT